MDRQRTPTSSAVGLLRRIVDLANRIIGGMWTLAIVAAICVAAAWLVWLSDSPVRGTEGWLERIVALGVLLSPSAVLLLFVSGLRELAKIPERVRALPVDVRAQVTTRRGSHTRGGLFSSLFRLARLAWGSRDVLSPYAAVSIALRPAILMAALGATAAALILVPASIVAILVMSVA